MVEVGKNHININNMLDRKISKLENDINNNYDEYYEDIEFISYKDIGIIIHKTLEYFDFQQIQKRKKENIYRK